MSNEVVTSEPKQFCFSFISDMVTCEIKQKQNTETILKSCFISHVTKSEIKLKQDCSVSVLFKFYIRCNHCITSQMTLHHLRLAVR